MLIGHITDLHILSGGELAFGVADALGALKALEDFLFNSRPPLDALVITGDLADRGERGAYEIIRDLFSRWRAPVFAVPGNHDRRAPFAEILGGFLGPVRPFSDNLSYSVSLPEAELVMLDGTIEGSHTGGLSGERALWLKEILDGLRPGAPVLVCAHHLPFPSGMGAMDRGYENSGGLLNILSGRENLTLCLGHLHAAFAARVSGVNAVCAPPPSLHMVPDISPSGGNAFRLGPPGYALHYVNGDNVISYFCSVPGSWPSSGSYSF